jgi:hypothetical protein
MSVEVVQDQMDGASRGIAPGEILSEANELPQSKGAQDDAHLLNSTSQQ